jgi:hypothetical protein
MGHQLPTPSRIRCWPRTSTLPLRKCLFKRLCVGLLQYLIPVGRCKRSFDSACNSVRQIGDSVLAFLSLPDALNGTCGQIAGRGVSDFSFSPEVGVQDSGDTGRVDSSNQHTVGRRALDIFFAAADFPCFAPPKHVSGFVYRDGAIQNKDFGRYRGAAVMRDKGRGSSSCEREASIRPTRYSLSGFVEGMPGRS